MVETYMMFFIDAELRLKFEGGNICASNLSDLPPGLSCPSSQAAAFTADQR